MPRLRSEPIAAPAAFEHDALAYHAPMRDEARSQTIRRHRSVARRGMFAVVMATWLATLGGCAGLARTPGAPDRAAGSTASPPASSAPRPATLAVERQWLQSWFEGTPVRIDQRSERSFSVEVPREFSFDHASSVVKPPLAAVLDKLAQSLLRQSEMRVDGLAAPGDGNGDGPGTSALAQQRGGNVRRHLMSRGVPAYRLAAPGVAHAAAVQLRVGLDAR